MKELNLMRMRKKTLVPRRQMRRNKRKERKKDLQRVKKRKEQLVWTETSLPPVVGYTLQLHRVALDPTMWGALGRSSGSSLPSSTQLTS